MEAWGGRCEFITPPVAIYERGEALKRRCEALLKQAEARIQRITLTADGRPEGVAPLDVS